MVVNKISTKIPELDDILGGGLPKGSICIFESSPGIPKELIASQVFYNRLKEGDCGLYVTTDNTPDGLINLWNNYGWNVEDVQKNGVLRFIDAYSKILGIRKPVSDKIIQVPNPQALIEFGIAMKQSNTMLWNINPNIINVIDSISTMALFLKADDCGMFFQTLIGRMRQQGVTGIILLESGMHDSRVDVSLKHFADVLFEFKNDEGTYMRVSGKNVDMSVWHSFEFTKEQGLKIKKNEVEKG